MTATTMPRARELLQTDRASSRANLTAEYAALVALVDGLAPGDWSKPTECTGWTVRHMVAHLAGSAECGARTGALLRHYSYAGWKSRHAPETFVDHMCQSQIASRDGMSDLEVAADLRRWATDAPAQLEATARLLRGIPLPAVTGAPPGARLSWFVDVITTRDVWMHRVDLTRALGVERPVTPAEPELVRQVIRDLDTEWRGPALDLTLTGPGGGSWRIGDHDPVAHITEDAVGLMRLLSGRSDECDLAADGDSAGVDTLRRARVLF